MDLYRISDRQPNYQETYFDGGDLKGMSVLSSDNHAVGKVQDILVDQDDRLKHLVVSLAQSQKKVLLPVRSCFKTNDPGSLYVRDLTLEQINGLADHGTFNGAETNAAVSSASSHTNVQTNGEIIPLFEERLETRKQRLKTGEIKISKQTVTDTVDFEVPVMREKVVIEIESIYAGQTRVDFDQAEVDDDGNIRMGIYEEQAEVCRRIVPYQNVSVRKEVVQDTVQAQQVLRREKLDVRKKGDPTIEQRISE